MAERSVIGGTQSARWAGRITASVLALAGSLVIVAGAGGTASAGPPPKSLCDGTCVAAFGESGTIQTFTVPPGVTSVTITATGGVGDSLGPGIGGNPGQTVATVTVTPGEVLSVVVGGSGAATGYPDGEASGGGGGSFVIDGSGNLLVGAGGGGAFGLYVGILFVNGGSGGGAGAAATGTNAATSNSNGTGATGAYAWNDGAPTFAQGGEGGGGGCFAGGSHSPLSGGGGGSGCAIGSATDVSGTAGVTDASSEVDIAYVNAAIGLTLAGTPVTSASGNTYTVTLDIPSGDEVPTGVVTVTDSAAGPGSCTSSTWTDAGSDGAEGENYTATCTISTAEASGQTVTASYDQSDYLVGPSNSLTVGAAAQAPLVITSTGGTVGTPLALATSGGFDGGSVTYVVGAAGSAGCTLAAGGATLDATSAGTCTVTATMAGLDGYSAVSSPATVVTFTAAAAAAAAAPPAAAPAPPAPSCAGGAFAPAFVCHLYVDLLNRTPDSGGLAALTGELTAGMRRSAVARQVLTSTEYRDDLVSSFYETYLGRGADPGGLAAFRTLLARGGSDETVQADILGSSECYAHVGGTPQAFLTALYDDLFGRVPNAAGLAGVEAELAAGLSRTAVAVQILDGSVYHTGLVVSYYQHYLGRAPDGGGLAAYRGLFDQGASNETVQSEILASPEFYHRAS